MSMWLYNFVHILLTYIFKMQFSESKNARIVLVEFYSPSSLPPFFSPRVIRFELFRSTTQVKVNDMTDGAGRKQMVFSNYRWQMYDSGVRWSASMFQSFMVTAEEFQDFGSLVSSPGSWKWN